MELPPRGSEPCASCSDPEDHLHCQECDRNVSTELVYMLPSYVRRLPCAACPDPEDHIHCAACGASVSRAVFLDVLVPRYWTPADGWE